MSELLKTEPEVVEVLTPLIHYNTSEFDYGLTWLNSKLRMYHDTGMDNVFWQENDKQSRFCVPDKLWGQLLEMKYPFSYYYNPELRKWWDNCQEMPDLEEYYEPVSYKSKLNNTFKLHWHNTRLRLYGEEEYNHAELRVLVDGDPKTLGITDLTPMEWRILFNQGFPIEYLPTIDLDNTSKKWFGRKDGA